MTVTLHLTKKQEILLQKKAKARGVDTSAVLHDIVVSALDNDQSPSGGNPAKRIFDLHKDNIIYISDDFDDELPDAFWFGED